MVGRRRGVEQGGGARNQDRMDENTSMEFGRRGPKRGLTEDPREDRAQRGPPAGAVLVESGGPWAAGTAEFRSGSRYTCWGHRAGMGRYC